MSTPSQLARLGGGMRIPLDLLTEAEEKAICAELKAKVGGMGEPVRRIEQYRIDEDSITVPRQYGIALAENLGIEWEDYTSAGDECAPWPKCPELRDYQQGPTGEVLERMRQDFDVVFQARTAYGKSITSVWLAVQLEATLLVIVDTEGLMEQWVDETIVKHFGLKASEVGIVRGDRCDYQGKRVTVAMLQTLRSREMGAEFWDYFGMVVLDECHVMGAEASSEILWQATATWRLFVSATPNRRDGGRKIIEWHAGPVKVIAAAEHAESELWIRRHGTVYSWYANISPKIGRLLTEMAEDGSRNLLVAESIAEMYYSGRDTLGIGDRVEQLFHLRAMLVYMGVPEEDIGVYAGDQCRWGWGKDPTPPGHPPGYEPAPDGQEPILYTPVRFGLQRRKTTKAEREHIKSSSAIILTTYGMFQKGMDVPRLKAGVDIHPRTDSKQPHGRIKRTASGLCPIWITIEDYGSYRLLNTLANRLPGYVEDNATVYLCDHAGQREKVHAGQYVREVRELKEELQRCRIETNLDGNRYLVEDATPRVETRMRESFKRKSE